MVVDALTSSFAASSGRNSKDFFLRSPAVFNPSTARLKNGSTSSSTISSRKTASGSNASFVRMTQSLNDWSLLMALPQLDLEPTLDASAIKGCELAHNTRNPLRTLGFSAGYMPPSEIIQRRNARSTPQHISWRAQM